MIIDMRLRPPLPSWTGQLQYSRDDSYYERLGYKMPPSVKSRSAEDLIREMDAAGIALGVVMGRQSASPLGVIPNAEIAEFVARHPDRFVGWVGLDLSQPTEWWLREIDEYIKRPGFKGVSIEPPISLDPTIHRCDDKRLYPIYEKCMAEDIPLNITLSAQLQGRLNRPYEDSSPLSLYRVAQDFPKLQIHVAHAAWPYVMEMIGVAFVCSNVWISPDQYMVPRLPGALEYVKAINNYCPRRGLFGTAYPSRGHAEMVRDYRELGFDKDTLENLFYRNARALMKLD